MLKLKSIQESQPQMLVAPDVATHQVHPLNQNHRNKNQKLDKRITNEWNNNSFFLLLHIKNKHNKTPLAKLATKFRTSSNDWTDFPWKSKEKDEETLGKNPIAYTTQGKDTKKTTRW